MTPSYGLRFVLVTMLLLGGSQVVWTMDQSREDPKTSPKPAEAAKSKATAQPAVKPDSLPQADGFKSTPAKGQASATPAQGKASTSQTPKPVSQPEKLRGALEKATEVRPAPRKLTQVEGTLTEARCYFTTGAVGGRHEHCAFMSMKANLPVGLLTAKGEFIYLVIESKRLANYATRPLRAEGETMPGGRVLRPEKLWVKNGTSWELVRD